MYGIVGFLERLCSLHTYVHAKHVSVTMIIIDCPFDKYGHTMENKSR